MKGRDLSMLDFDARKRESGGWSVSRPSNFTMGKRKRYPSYSRLDGLRGRPGCDRKISSLLEIEPRNIYTFILHFN